VKSVLGDAERDAEAIPNALSRTAALCDIARAHAWAGQRDAAAAVLRKALEAEGLEQGVVRGHGKDNRVSMIAECQAETGDVKGALETIDGAVSAMNRTSALRYVATAQARAGDINGALATVERMQPVRADDPFKDEALRQIAVAQAEADDSKGALETAGRISGQTHYKTIALAAIVAALFKAGDKDGAAKLVGQIRELIPGAGVPRDLGLTALAEAQAALGMLEDALKTAKEIADLQWRDGARWRMATAQAARGDVKAARQTAEAIEDGYRKGDALKDIVRALVRAKDLPGAGKLTAEIGHDIGRCYALMEVAQAQAAAGQKAEAEKSFQEALKLADRLENPPQMGGVREAALIHWAKARATSGDPEGALAWVGKQDDPWVRATLRPPGAAGGRRPSPCPAV
jgi:tetratricopeptide (TPR) repeat protein